MNTSEVLNAAADLIEERGWYSGKEKPPPGINAWFPAPGSTHPVCADGALRVVTFGGLEYGKAKRVLIDHLTDMHPDLINPLLGYVPPWIWNDCRAESAEQVIATLRAAAVIEAAKENPTAANSPATHADTASEAVTGR